MQAIHIANSIAGLQKPKSQGFRWTAPLFGGGAIVGLFLGVASFVMHVVAAIPIGFFVLSAFLIFASIESYRFGGLDRLATYNDRLEKTIQTLEHENTELMDTDEQITQQLNRYQEKIASLELLKVEHEAELNELKKFAKSTEKEINRLKKENQSLDEIVIRMESVSEDLDDDAEKYERILKEYREIKKDPEGRLALKFLKWKREKELN